MTLDEECELVRLRTENAELRELVAASQGRVAELNQQLAVAMERIDGLEVQLKQRGAPPGMVKPKQQKPAREGPRKKRAAEHNTSRKRMVPTRIERHALDRCPECAYRLTGESLDYRREVIELPPPQPVDVIEHQVVKRWCPHCESWRSPRLDLQGQVFGQGRIGVRVAALISYLRTTLRLPVRQVQQYLATLHNLRLSIGELVALGHAVRQQLQGAADDLLRQVRQQPVVHQDETGWRENGANGYVWTTVSDGPAAVRHYQYSPSRGSVVAQKLIGDGFQGVLVSDFYAAYNRVPGRHQRCWVHLLRDLHELKAEPTAGEDVVTWATAVRGVYDTAQAWLTAHPDALPEERQRQYADYYQRSCTLGQQYAFTVEHPCQTLAKRLLRHQEELFQFVLQPGLPADNNLAERSLRPLVIMRKISGGTRSAAGSKTRLTLASLLGTWQARGLNPLIECLRALQPPTEAATAASS